MATALMSPARQRDMHKLAAISMDLPASPSKEGAEFSSCSNALLTFCSQTSDPSLQTDPQPGSSHIQHPTPTYLQASKAGGNHAMGSALSAGLC